MKFELVSFRIKEAMNDMNISASELSRRSGIGKSSISHYVNGDNCPNNMTAYALAMVLGVRPEWLMGFPVDKNKEEIPEYDPQIQEVTDLFCKLTKEQKQTVLSMLRSFVN